MTGNITGFFSPRQNLNDAHHASVLVFEKVTVINEGSHDVRISEVHAQGDAGINSALTIPERYVHGVFQERFVNLHAIEFEEQEVDLMDVKGVQFFFERFSMIQSSTSP